MFLVLNLFFVFNFKIFPPIGNQLICIHLLFNLYMYLFIYLCDCSLFFFICLNKIFIQNGITTKPRLLKHLLIHCSITYGLIIKLFVYIYSFHHVFCCYICLVCNFDEISMLIGQKPNFSYLINKGRVKLRLERVSFGLPKNSHNPWTRCQFCNQSLAFPLPGLPQGIAHGLAQPCHLFYYIPQFGCG